jgi:hypothetical protein
MGFALWLDRDTAWCAGTHEYRPMGTAVVAATDLFSPRDFHSRRPAPTVRSPAFRGFFASLEAVNRYLRHPASRRRAPAKRTLRLRGIL